MSQNQLDIHKIYIVGLMLSEKQQENAEKTEQPMQQSSQASGYILYGI